MFSSLGKLAIFTYVFQVKSSNSTSFITCIILDAVLWHFPIAVNTKRVLLYCLLVSLNFLLQHRHTDEKQLITKH